MIMQNSVHDPQDQRIASCMEDSTAMTIEFLRARLLSERSISRSARQRADELSKKVMELEEQLRMVTFQRKMAEKATADVLAILEDQGISDASEEFDSGSDIENFESGLSNDSAKDGERSTSSNGRQHEYGSHVDSSPVSGKSLSWKGRHDSPRFLEKYKASNSRRQNSFSSINSSPKHRLGNSCRKIRDRQTRSVEKESRDKSVEVNHQENEYVSSSEGLQNCSDGGSNVPRIESKIQEDESELNLVNKDHHVDGYGQGKDMEKALEHQALLIDQYEAMEKAQREWEEKFRENNSITPDSCDLGNHSDMTEDKDESKAQIPSSAKVLTSNSQEEKIEPTDVSLSEEKFKSEARDIMQKSYNDTAGYSPQKNTIVGTSDFFGQENSDFPLKGNQNESSVNSHCQPSDMNHQDPRGRGYSDSGLTQSSPPNDRGGQPEKDASRNNDNLYALVSHGQSHEFNSVLESLKQAKISLQQELKRLPPVEGGVGYSSKAIKPSAFVSKSEDRFDIPVGCSALFRLPTDFSDARFGFRDSTSGFGSNFHLNGGISRTSDGQFHSNPYSATTLRLSSSDGQSHATQYLENGSRADSEQPRFGLLSNGDPSSSGRYMYPTFSLNPSYQNMTPQMSFGDERSRPHPSSSTVGVPSVYRFSFQGDHLR